MPDEKTVLLVGDPILDRRLVGEMVRISPEAPVPIVRQQASVDQPGGAANVACNIWSLGGAVRFAGLLGADVAGHTLAGLLRDQYPGISTCLSQPPGVQTPVKTRIAVGGQQLLRVDDEGPATGCVSDELVFSLNAVLQPGTDVGLIVVSDYCKGTMTPAVIGLLQQASWNLGIPLFVDAKPAAVPQYAGASLLKVNQAEIVQVAKDAGYVHPGLLLPGEQTAVAADYVQQRFGFDIVVATQGHGGAYVTTREGYKLHQPSPVLRDSVDVTGAGDVILAALAVACLEGQPVASALRFSQVAAGLVAAVAGTVAVLRDSVEDALLALGGAAAKVMSREAAATLIGRRRRAGKTLVLANGCFDVLHAGHIQLLYTAKSAGDLLVVACNDDESIRALKGDQRPIVSQSSRCFHLALCEPVDCVFTFDGDVETLVRWLRPDVLVKGAEYQATKVPGADFLAGRGGRVFFAPMLPGISTTHLQS